MSQPAPHIMCVKIDHTLARIAGLHRGMAGLGRRLDAYPYSIKGR